MTDIQMIIIECKKTKTGIMQNSEKQSLQSKNKRSKQIGIYIYVYVI